MVVVRAFSEPMVTPEAVDVPSKCRKVRACIFNRKQLRRVKCMKKGYRCHMTSHHVTSRHITSHYVTSNYVTIRLVTFHHVKSRHNTSCHITLNYAKVRHVTLPHITTYHNTSCLVKLRQLTLRHITSHHVTLRRVTCLQRASPLSRRWTRPCRTCLGSRPVGTRAVKSPSKSGSSTQPW